MEAYLFQPYQEILKMKIIKLIMVKYSPTGIISRQVALFFMHLSDLSVCA